MKKRREMEARGRPLSSATALQCPVADVDAYALPSKLVVPLPKAVARAKKGHRFPRHIALEATALQYLLDLRIDRVLSVLVDGARSAAVVAAAARGGGDVPALLRDSANLVRGLKAHALRHDYALWWCLQAKRLRRVQQGAERAAPSAPAPLSVGGGVGDGVALNVALAKKEAWEITEGRVLAWISRHVEHSHTAEHARALDAKLVTDAGMRSGDGGVGAEDAAAATVAAARGEKETAHAAHRKRQAKRAVELSVSSEEAKYHTLFAGLAMAPLAGDGTSATERVDTFVRGPNTRSAAGGGNAAESLKARVKAKAEAKKAAAAGGGRRRMTRLLRGDAPALYGSFAATALAEPRALNLLWSMVGSATESGGASGSAAAAAPAYTCCCGVRDESIWFGSLGYRAMDPHAGRDGAGSLLRAGRIALHEHHIIEARTLREAQELFVYRVVARALEQHIGSEGGGVGGALARSPLHVVLSIASVQHLEGARNVRRARVLSVITPGEILRKAKTKAQSSADSGASSSVHRAANSGAKSGPLPKNLLRDVKRSRAALRVEMLFNAYAPSSDASGGGENVYHVYVPLSKLCTMRWINVGKAARRGGEGEGDRAAAVSSSSSSDTGAESSDAGGDSSPSRRRKEEGAGPPPAVERTRVAFLKKSHALRFFSRDAARAGAPGESTARRAAAEAAARNAASDAAAAAARVLEMDIATAASDGNWDMAYTHLLSLALVHGGPNAPSMRGAPEMHFDGKPHHPRRWSSDAVRMGVRAGVRMLCSVAPTLRHLSDALACAVSLLLRIDEMRVEVGRDRRRAGRIAATIRRCESAVAVQLAWAGSQLEAVACAPTFVALRGGRAAALEQLRRAQFLLGTRVTTRRFATLQRCAAGSDGDAHVEARAAFTLGDAAKHVGNAANGVAGDGRSGSTWTLADEAGEAALLVKGVAEFARLAAVATAELVHISAVEVHGVIKACASGVWVVDTLPPLRRKK